MNHHDPMKPMLASPGPLPSSGDGSWAYEVKWDGMRVLATSRPGGLRLATRTGADATSRFPEISAVVPPDLPVASVLDGEIVVLDDEARPCFALLAPRIQARAARRPVARPATFVVFDLLRLGSRDVMGAPYSERRALLEDVVASRGAVVVPESFDDGEALVRTTAERGLEGVVAKRRRSTYQPGVRSRDWVKVPHRVAHSFVVGGWKSRADSPGRLASLLVGTPAGEGMLAFDGAVGSGLGDDEARTLLEVLRDIETTPRSPFEPEVTRSAGSDLLRWVEPLLVVDVSHLGRSAQGLLRQPSVARLRPDLSYAEVAAGAGA
jgi:bifunctional non-homologous end joining protein LigD